MLTLNGCSAVEHKKGSAANHSGKVETASSRDQSDTCMAEIEWMDFLFINGINYLYNQDGSEEVKDSQLGEQLGEVSFLVSNHACTNYTRMDGDAAFLPIGTPIYALKGYKPEFRVVANYKVYEVNENAKAATMGDLLDIRDRVVKVSLDSGLDGSHIGDFSPEASTAFIDQLLPLAHIEYQEIYKNAKPETGIFLRVHLKDQTSIRMVFYPNANAFTLGAYGTEQLKALIMAQRAQIKSAAGL
ncbi:hypothetical protein [Paenibacillus curdlanolyticus]|nr:hypothetical protein [Paenibacillus curdlanolyticus]